MPVIINSGNRIVSTVGKHVIAEDALSSRSEGVGIEESTQCGVIISGLAVIQPGFFIVHVSTITQGIISGELVIGGIGDVAPGIVIIGCIAVAVAVNQTSDIALCIQHIVQNPGVVLHREGPSILVVEEVHGGGITDGHPHQLAALVAVSIEHPIHGLARPQTVRAISIADIIGVVGRGRQLPSVPLEVPPGAVVVTGGVAVCALESAMESENSMAYS